MNRSLLPSQLALIVFCVTVSLGPVALCNETDWAQWRGPDRDGHAADQSLLKSWPEGGPKLKWTFSDSGVGYSSVAISDGFLYTMGSDKENCYVICVDAKTGTESWRQSISRAGVNGDYLGGWGVGPRSTPTIDGGQVFALSDVGTLACLTLKGDITWSVDLVADYGGSIPKWGYSESPLIDGNRVVVTPGGDNFMIALDRKSGEKIWGSSGDTPVAEYVSVMKGRVGETDYYVTASTPGLLAFDCESGKQLFSDEATGNPTAVIPTPIITGDLLYHTSDYGAGNTLLKLSSNGEGIDTESVYALQGKTMLNHHGGVVLVDGTIYGFSKMNGGVWMAQDLESGDLLWNEKIGRNRSGSICYADGMLYCYNDKDGSVHLAEASRDGWSSKGSVTLPKQTDIPRDRGAIWAHPIVANQMLIIRDQDLIYAFDIAGD